jgi:glycolate oxidase
LAKSRFMEKEVGAGTILYSKRLKAALDPKNILNPGKSIGEASSEP